MHTSHICAIRGRNYVVDFGDLLMSFPNYYSLGPNIDFFHAHGVRGVFEEGVCVRARARVCVTAFVCDCFCVCVCLCVCDCVCV